MDDKTRHICMSCEYLCDPCLLELPKIPMMATCPKLGQRIHLESGIVGDWDGAYDWAEDGEWIAMKIPEDPSNKRTR
jgi:hypothetical protein